MSDTHNVWNRHLIFNSYRDIAHSSEKPGEARKRDEESASKADPPPGQMWKNDADVVRNKAAGGTAV